MRSCKPVGLAFLLLAAGTRGAAQAPFLTGPERAYLAQHGPLRICVDPDYPPFDFVDRAGNHRGIAADYLAEISRLLGVRTVRVPSATWEETLHLARSGRCDVLPLLNRTPTRETFLDFTPPYLVSGVSIVSREPEYHQGLSSLAGKTVALPTGYRFFELVSTEYPQIRILPVASEDEALRAVSRGDADATLVNQQRLLGEVQRLGLAHIHYAGETHLRDEFRVGVREGDAVLLSIMTKAVARVPEARVRSIMQRWYVVPVESSLDWRMLATILACVLALGSLLLLHVYHQRRFSRLLQVKNRELEHLSETDALTQTANRRRIDARLPEEIERARRHRRPLSVILFDIDRFKEVNDSHGHQVGDRVLVELVETTRQVLRSSDVLGRWGGEEFILLCPETPGEQAEVLAERLRRRVGEHVFADGVGITISAGVAALEPRDDAHMLLNRADLALYAAKAAGRNRVMAAAAIGS